MNVTEAALVATVVGVYAAPWARDLIRRYPAWIESAGRRLTGSGWFASGEGRAVAGLLWAALNALGIASVLTALFAYDGGPSACAADGPCARALLSAALQAYPASAFWSLLLWVPGRRSRWPAWASLAAAVGGLGAGVASAVFMFAAGRAAAGGLMVAYQAGIAAGAAGHAALLLVGPNGAQRRTAPYVQF